MSRNPIPRHFSTLLVLLTLVASGAAHAASVRWERVAGTFRGALSVAACSDGSAYVLDASGNLYRNADARGGGAWAYQRRLASANQLSCVGSDLHHFDSARRLYRLNPNGTTAAYIGRPGGARSVVGSLSLALIFPAPQFFALNDDQSLWFSTSGRDGTWQRMGRPGSAEQIAVGGGVLESRAFAFNFDRNLYMNGGAGCDRYWVHLGRMGATRRITAKNMNEIYALNDDGSLWYGAVQVERRTVTLTSNQFRDLVGTALNGTRVRLHDQLGTVTPGPLLRLAGLATSTFPLPRIPVPDGVAYINDANLSRTTLSLSGSQAVLDAVFEESGADILVTGWIPDFDLINFNGQIRLGVTQSACRQPRLEVDAVQFNGELRARAFLIDWIYNLVVEDLVDLEGEVEGRLTDAVEAMLDSEQGATAVSDALLTAAGFLTGGDWQGVVPGSTRITSSRLTFQVER